MKKKLKKQKDICDSYELEIQELRTLQEEIQKQNNMNVRQM
jgi:hypothetical protein